jgi:hypothetical protein
MRELFVVYACLASFFLSITVLYGSCHAIACAPLVVCLHAACCHLLMLQPLETLSAMIIDPSFSGKQPWRIEALGKVGTRVKIVGTRHSMGRWDREMFHAVPCMLESAFNSGQWHGVSKLCMHGDIAGEENAVMHYCCSGMCLKDLIGWHLNMHPLSYLPLYVCDQQGDNVFPVPLVTSIMTMCFP